jgi:hypothetical protein
MERTQVASGLMSGLAVITLAGALAQIAASPAFADSGSPGCCTYGSDCQPYPDAPWCRVLGEPTKGGGLMPCSDALNNYCCANQTGACMC